MKREIVPGDLCLTTRLLSCVPQFPRAYVDKGTIVMCLSPAVPPQQRSGIYADLKIVTLLTPNGLAEAVCRANACQDLELILGSRDDSKA